MRLSQGGERHSGLEWGGYWATHTEPTQGGWAAEPASDAGWRRHWATEPTADAGVRRHWAAEPTADAG